MVVTVTKAKVGKVMAFEGLRRAEVDEAHAGDLVVISGVEEVTIGETLADLENPVALAPIHVDAPTRECFVQFGAAVGTTTRMSVG